MQGLLKGTLSALQSSLTLLERVDYGTGGWLLLIFYFRKSCEVFIFHVFWLFDILHNINIGGVSIFLLLIALIVKNFGTRYHRLVSIMQDFWSRILSLLHWICPVGFGFRNKTFYLWLKYLKFGWWWPIFIVYFGICISPSLVLLLIIWFQKIDRGGSWMTTFNHLSFSGWLMAFHCGKVLDWRRLATRLHLFNGDFRFLTLMSYLNL